MSTGADLGLTTSQRATLDKFRSRLTDVLQPHHDDHHLVKWLKARSWDVTNAEKMFRDNQEWRKINDVDNILSTYEPPEVITKYYPGGYCGVTKEGYPIWIESLAKGDQRGFYQSVSVKELLRHKIWENEKFYKIISPELSKKYEKKIDQWVEIVDSEGLGLKFLWKPAIDAMGELATMAEEHYPDMYRSIIAINVPSVLPLVYSMFKPFLSQDTRSKIKIYSSNYKEHLLKEIDADQLPVHWGGTATDPDGDPYCRSKVCMGGQIPEHFYRKKMLVENNDLSKFTSVTVRKGSALELDFEVKVKESLLSWNFYTDDNDIGFGVYRRTTPEQHQKACELDAILPTERVKSHLIPEAGRVECKIPGTYVAIFDNNYSWLNAKKVYYLIEVVEPASLQDLQVIEKTHL